jgi:hypothetical protein
MNRWATISILREAFAPWSLFISYFLCLSLSLFYFCFSFFHSFIRSITSAADSPINSLLLLPLFFYFLPHFQVFYSEIFRLNTKLTRLERCTLNASTLTLQCDDEKDFGLRGETVHLYHNCNYINEMMGK